MAKRPQNRDDDGPRRARPLTEREQEIIDLAKKRFALAETADKDQRKRELDDLRFYAGDQWTPTQKKAREGMNATTNLPPLPERPTLVINKVRQPVQQVVNDIRQSDFGFELAAADDFGELIGNQNADEIELREGLVRRIQRSSEASDARLWAAMRAAIAGRGYYAVLTRFVPVTTKMQPTAAMWDREIYIHRFFNQACVTIDPAHEQPDGSDAKWGFIGVDIPIDEYEALYPKVVGQKNTITRKMGKDAWRQLGDEAPGWFTEEKKTRMVRVVDYLYLEYESRTLCLLEDGTAAWKDELSKGAKVADERDVLEQRVKWVKMDGYQILDEPEWEGPDLPIVKVLGEELQPYDNERRSEGMVRPARDSQSGYNAMISKFVETVGLAPIPPLILDPESIEQWQAWYQLASTRALPFLPQRTRDDQGREFRKAERPAVDPPIQAMAVAIQMFDESIQSTTGVPDSRQGKNRDSQLKAAKAILALQQQSEQGTSNYRDNLKRSVRREAEIVNNLLYPIYGKRPGRMTSIVLGEGDSKPVQIGGTAKDGQQKVYTLTPDMRGNIVVKVTRSFDSRRQEETSTIADLLNANPLFMTWFGDLFFENQDGPGHMAMAERAKVMLDPKIQQMLASRDQGAEIPPEVQQLVAAKDQQIQHAEAAIQQLADEARSKKLELDSKERIAAADRAQRADDAQKDRALKLAIAHITASKDTDISARESQEERVALGMELDHDAAIAAADAAHEEDMARLAHDAAVAQTGQEQSGQAVLADQGQEHALMAAEQAAALAPKPEEAGV